MKFQKASEADFHMIQKFYWNVIDDIHRNNVNNENLGWEKAFIHRTILFKAALSYITATHDQKNPRSENVMKKLGMKYCYSYDGQWQPKDFPVTFRMYQLNFDGKEDFIYKKYWDMSYYHFIENL